MRIAWGRQVQRDSIVACAVRPGASDTHSVWAAGTFVPVGVNIEMELREMKFNAIRIAAMAILLGTAACGTQHFPAGVYVASQPSPTDRITEFTFAEDGTFTSAYYDGKAATGTYTISGDKITLVELNQDSPCLEAPATMTWRASGSNLTLGFFEDQCREGPSYDWAREWTRKP